MFHAHREPEAAWVAACQQVAPPTDAVSHCVIRWVPGTPAVPIQRWMICECIPRAALTFADGSEHPVLAQMDPASDDPLHRWAWEYLTTRGALPVPMWAVQGPHGGHPVRWTRAEQEFANAGVLVPRDLPAIGDLAYAEPDARTWRAIAQRSVLHRTITDAYEARVVARQFAAQRARQAELDQLAAQVADVIPAAGRDLVAHAKVVDATERRDVGGLITDDDLARYIETGELAHR